MDNVQLLYSVLEHYENQYIEHQNSMGQKIGIDNFAEADEALVIELDGLLQKVETDMTIFFRLLSTIETPNIGLLESSFYDKNTIPTDEWNSWLEKWWKRVNNKPNREAMRKANPKYVLRNWMAQLAIDAAENEDYTVCEELFTLLKHPYDEQPEMEEKWFQKCPEWARHRSCSS